MLQKFFIDRFLKESETVEENDDSVPLKGVYLSRSGAEKWRGEALQSKGHWQDSARSMPVGWNKEHFEPHRALSCLLIDLPRARASCFW